MILRALILVLVSLVSLEIRAQTVILTCPNDFGASQGCNVDSPGGCNQALWQLPDPKWKVRTDASSFWTVLGSLKDTDKVAIATGLTPGSVALCSQITGSVTKASLNLPVTTPQPPGPPSANPQCGNNCFSVSWTAPTLNIDGTPAVVTNYRLIWNGPTNGSTLTGLVLAYTVTGLPAGLYTVTMTALGATSESNPTNPVNATVVAVSVPPPLVVGNDTTLYRMVSNLTSTGNGQLILTPCDRGSPPTCTVQFGTVPTGTTCDSTQTITSNGITYYRVDRTTVTFLGNNKPSVVFSTCK